MPVMQQCLLLGAPSLVGILVRVSTTFGILNSRHFMIAGGTDVQRHSKLQLCSAIVHSDQFYHLFECMLTAKNFLQGAVCLPTLLAVLAVQTAVQHHWWILLGCCGRAAGCADMRVSY